MAAGVQILAETAPAALTEASVLAPVLVAIGSAPEARSRLMEELNLSEIQASDILEMPLRRLTALARLELEAEIASLREEIAGYEALLESPTDFARFAAVTPEAIQKVFAAQIRADNRVVVMVSPEVGGEK